MSLGTRDTTQSQRTSSGHSSSFLALAVCGIAASFVLGALSPLGAGRAWTPDLDVSILFYLIPSVIVACVVVAIGVRIVASAAKEAVHAAVLPLLSILLGALMFGGLATAYVVGGVTPYLLGMGHRNLDLFAGSSEDFVGGWSLWLLILMILAWITAVVIGGTLGLLAWSFRDARWLVRLGERWPWPWRSRVVLPGVAGLLVLAAPIVWFTGPSPRPTEFTAGNVEEFAAGSATLFEDYGVWLVRLQSGDFVAVDQVAQPSLCRVSRRPDSEFRGQPA